MHKQNHFVIKRGGIHLSILKNIMGLVSTSALYIEDRIFILLDSVWLSVPLYG